MKLALALACAAPVACDRRPAVTSCDDNLDGVWVTPAHAHWMMLDHGATLEAYPMFDDGSAGESMGAPRAIDLTRGDKLAGEIKRRFMRGADLCDAHAPIHVAKCKDDALEVVLADVVAPIAYAPCEWPQPAPSRVEWWKRAR